MLDENDRVIVRIWTSGFNKVHPGENVGHISIESENPKRYYSLWPSKPTTTDGLGLFQVISPELKQDYSADYRAEGRDPEVVICLYSLTGTHIETEFNGIKKNLQGWQLIGSNILSRSGGTAKENCSSFAYRLLKAGGIYDSVSSSWSSKFSSIVTPDGLVDLVKSAKQYELREHPETQNFSFDNETGIAPAQEKGGCALS